ncbi:MAG: SDR family NAD(P)-dependent oxidoreductase [Sphingobium sp.]
MTTTFGAESTTDEVLANIDLTGKRVLVTGASSGLGVETARALAAHGAQVIGAVRDLEKGREATRAIEGIELVECDLTSLESVRACVDALVTQGKPLDIIIANAGVMAMPFGLTKDGFEMHLGTNHLGHFVLVNRLVPLLRDGSRVISLTSGGHRAGDVDLDDPNFEQTPYNDRAAYGRSKTANSLFAVEFDRRHRDRGIRAVAVHPGTIDTPLSRHQTPEVKAAQIAAINAALPAGAPPFRYKTVEQGAATSVWAAAVADADAVGGRYCENCHVADINDTPGSRVGVRSHALDADRAKALWAKSNEWAGENF